MRDYLKELDKYYFPPRPWVDLSIEAIFQDRYELATFAFWVDQMNVMSCLEVGVASGGLMHFMSMVLGVKCRGIDVVSPCMVPPEWVHLANCHSPEAVEWAREGGMYDVVLIDADHTYEAVAKDYELYKGMAAKMVVLHDIAHDTLPGPRKLFDSIVGDKFEIVHVGASLGIGIIFVEGGKGED